MSATRWATGKGPLQSPAFLTRFYAKGAVLSVMYITNQEERSWLWVCLGKMKSEAGSDQLVTLTRCLYEALPIDYRDLPSPALD